MGKVAEIHICTKKSFEHYSWFKEISPDGIKEIMDPSNIGLVVTKHSRYIALLSTHSPKQEELSILMNNLISLVSQVKPNKDDVPSIAIRVVGKELKEWNENTNGLVPFINSLVNTCQHIKFHIC